MTDPIAKTLIPISVLVQTKNEENGIAACLDGWTDFGEVIVVDSHSTDRTREIAESKGVKVIDFQWNGQYPKKKQWQLENVRTKYPWIFFVDADETPTDALRTELEQVFVQRDPSREVSAFDVPLSYVFEGRRMNYGHRVVKRALVRPGKVIFPELADLDGQGMGELEGHYQPLVEGQVLRLSATILHNDIDPISSWFERHNRYSDWEAHIRTKPGLREQIRRLRSGQGQLFEKAPLKPLVFFLYSYLLRQGWRDGRVGLDYATALAFYYWQIGVKVRELKRIDPDGD